MIDCSKTENYFAEKARMTRGAEDGICKLDCLQCPLSTTNNGTNDKMSCVDFEALCSKKAISIVQKWSNEHPQKTYLSELLKAFPNAQLNDSGMPKGMCPHELGLKDIDCGKTDNACVKCWNQPLPEREEEEEK